MRGFRYRSLALLAAVAMTTWRCGSTSTTPTTTTTTTAPAVSVTEVFTGPLSPNGAITFSFTSTSAGGTSATLTAINPDTGLTLGLAIGLLSGTTCELKLTNDLAISGTTVTGTAGAGSALCARVYDANGVVTTTEQVSVTVVHF